MKGICISGLIDPIYSVREVAVVNLCKLVEIFGADWAKENLYPKIISISKNDNYLYRLSALFFLNNLIVNYENNVKIFILKMK